jgi:SAM-dependent methyltransferase
LRGVEDQVYAQLYALEDEHWWFRGRRAVIWALLRGNQLPANPRVLDAGCGTGRNLLEFGGLGRGWGVDPSPHAVAFCRQRGLQDVTQAGLEELPFEDHSFDLLLAFDVLEHIERDGQALAELRRVAEPEASLLITVPAYQWLWSHHDTSHHHQRRYTLPLLRERVVGAGWRVRKATYFNSLLLAPIAVARRLSPNSDNNGGGTARSDYDRTPKVLSRVLEAPMKLEAEVIARGHALPAGVSIGMVCTPS